jgi:hypothetical protein
LEKIVADRRYVEVVFPSTFSDDEGELTREALMSNAAGKETYIYFTYLENDFKLGEYGVVVGRGQARELSIVRILRVVDSETLPEGLQYKPLIATLDLSVHFDNVRRIMKANAIKKSLGTKLKQIEEFRKYEFLRQYDPEAASMLDELEMLTGIKTGLPPTQPPEIGPTSATDVT